MENDDADRTATDPSVAPPPCVEAERFRVRADRLARLASDIERSLVMTLPDRVEAVDWSTRRARLCEAMLESNLHQLHRAADDLRTTALRFSRRADELDAAAAAA